VIFLLTIWLFNSNYFTAGTISSVICLGIITFHFLLKVILPIVKIKNRTIYIHSPIYKPTQINLDNLQFLKAYKRGNYPVDFEFQKSGQNCIVKIMSSDLCSKHVEFSKLLKLNIKDNKLRESEYFEEKNDNIFSKIF
jgi:hypothetical protein